MWSCLHAPISRHNRRLTIGGNCHAGKRATGLEPALAFFLHQGPSDGLSPSPQLHRRGPGGAHRRDVRFLGDLSPLCTGGRGQLLTLSVPFPTSRIPNRYRHWSIFRAGGIHFAPQGPQRDHARPAAVADADFWHVPATRRPAGIPARLQRRRVRRSRACLQPRARPDLSAKLPTVAMNQTSLTRRARSPGRVAPCPRQATDSRPNYPQVGVGPAPHNPQWIWAPATKRSGSAPGSAWGTTSPFS